jgi:hypothetical protein
VNLYKRIRQVTLEVAIPKARRSRPKIRILNRTPSSLRHALPRNSRLFASLLITRNKLMIHRPNTNITDLRPCARKRRTRFLLVIAVRADRHSPDRRRIRRSGEPNNDILPVVAVPESGAGGVLGHVPAVHDGEGAVVCAAADVDLPWGGGTAGVGAAGCC